MENGNAKRENRLASAKIRREPLDVRAIEEQVSAVSNGAVCTFVGQVRNHSRGRAVAFLEYDAYVPMAEKTLASLARQAASRWNADIAVEHRFGRIELGEPSVVVCAGSPHREQAFEACRWLIDSLKENVPIWKKETTPEGTFWIEGEVAVPSAGS